jgi:hypothetical protein
MKRTVLLAVSALVGAAVAAGFAAEAGAQVIFAPVQYQYDASAIAGSGGGNVFYYGGSDPVVFNLAIRSSIDPNFGRVRGYSFYSSRRQVEGGGGGRAPAYSDAFPGVDLAPFGYTANDTRNYAYRSVPTYFRKSDLVRSAVPQPDGSFVVPPTAGGEPRVYVKARGQTETLARGTILILPAKKASPRTPGQVASR